MRLFILSTPGRRIAEARSLKGWAQSDLADKVGTSQQNIALIEKKSPSTSRYYLPIAEALGMDLQYILKGEKKPSTAPGADDIESIISIGEGALEQAITSYKAIHLQRGQSVDDLDVDLLTQAFSIALRGKLTGDYITASLSSHTLKKA